jgi:hypothetical protein
MNMRKKLFVVLVVLLLATSGAFAAKGSGLAIGGEGAMYYGSVGGLPVGAMLTLHLPQFPLMLGIGVSAPFTIGITADDWVAHGNLVSVFDWYAGVGGYLSFDPTPLALSVGGRVPLGLQMWPLGQSLELFLEIAPAVGFSLVPTGFDWHFQGAVGVRFWF